MPAATAAPARAPRQTPRARGCAAASGSLTDASSPGRSARSATARCSSASCTGRRAGWSSSPSGARRDGRLQIATRRRADHFLRRRSAPAEADWLRAAAGARRASRGRRRGGVRRPGRHGSARAATSTRSARPASCGSTSTSPTSCRRCGRSSPSGPAICWSRPAAQAARTPTGSSSSRCRRRV